MAKRTTIDVESLVAWVYNDAQADQLHDRQRAAPHDPDLEAEIRFIARTIEGLEGRQPVLRQHARLGRPKPLCDDWAPASAARDPREKVRRETEEAEARRWVASLVRLADVLQMIDEVKPGLLRWFEVRQPAVAERLPSPVAGFGQPT
jgi:hypothetical protein